MSHKPEVLVVGAGPVGLAAALLLHRAGVQVEIVDTHQRTTQHSYALAIHPRTVGLLDEAGLADAVIASGRKLTAVAYYQGSERRAAIDYSRLASRHPYLLVVRQSLLERALVEALGREQVRVRWGHRLQGLAADADGVTADVAHLDLVATGYPVARTEWLVKSLETIRTAYVIGADGYDSAVRRMAGFEMDEQGSPRIFSIYEIEAQGELPGEVRVVLDPDAISVYWPLEQGRCRWGFQIADAAAYDASHARLAQLLAARAPWFTAKPAQIYWSSVASFAARLSRSFGRGRVWLAGDAAHLAAPVGVRSMNSGLLEARELAARIPQALRSSSSAPLERYDAEMHATWKWLLDPAGAVRALPAADPWVAENRARIPACVPASGNDLEQLLHQIGLAGAGEGSSARA